MNVNSLSEHESSPRQIKEGLWAFPPNKSCNSSTSWWINSSVESVLAQIRGIKIAYPSTGADLKGLMKSAYYDPNPVVILEHKGLYWSKIKGTSAAKTVEPSKDYILPFGKGTHQNLSCLDDFFSET